MVHVDMVQPSFGPTSPQGPGLDDMAVVIVLHNSGDVIAGCLERIPAPVQLIVVDNASSDGGAARVRDLRPDAAVIESALNLGFGGGCNLGWRASTRPYVAFVNPDVRLEPGALQLLLARAQAEPHTMVGPELLDESGAVRPIKLAPSARLDFLGLLPAAQRWAPAGADGKANARPGSEGGRVASVEGACFVMARDDLARLGGFDEDLFLYYEEESLALRLSALGGGAVYEPRARAVHAGETSTRKVGQLALEHRFRSRVIFYRKRDGELRGRLVALALSLAALTRLAALAARPGRQGPTTQEDVRAVLRGLRRGLRAPITRTGAGARTRADGS
jgi:N-acetylglucosaminyl-diphospho-decaprenol L-rhamnosyltransferase